MRTPAQGKTELKFPYKDAGLTERQAAAHLVSRFTYGATPGQVDALVHDGLEKWFEQQLQGLLPDDSLLRRLAGYDALNMTNAEVNQSFPRSIQMIRMAMKEGIIPKDSANDSDRKKYKQELAEYIQQKKFRQQSELFRQFIDQKILRATYSNNQLHEILTEFWFNHFNVSLTKKECAMYIPAYERDAIRPYITGRFENLLLATAKSPAMLVYLDNFSSAGEMKEMSGAIHKPALTGKMTNDSAYEILKRFQQSKNNRGLNENYAREVMELHTLGVEGGYNQQDVIEAARILTGWTLYPVEDGYGNPIKKLVEKIGDDELKKFGFVHEGDFLFAMNRHDTRPKKVMGKNFPANGGFEEGVELMTMLAHHPSTASFICKKIAIHFVSDDPPQSLVDKMARVFIDKEGDIKEVLTTMVNAPEFWDKQVIRNKTKSPFELAISAARALNADLQQPAQLFKWAEKMGQKIYYFQAPTGFPDKAQYWINTGALLNRMNFGLAISSPQMRGIKTDLLRLNNYHEPESPSAALLTYGSILMPERDLSTTIKRLTPLITEPSLEKKLVNALEKQAVTTKTVINQDDLMGGGGINESIKKEKIDSGKINGERPGYNLLSQVVGIIIGSPEFQRK